MRRLLAGLALVASACSAARSVPSSAAAAPRPAVRDRDLGLSRTSVFETPAPPAWKAEDSAPGDQPLPARLSTTIPPVIPHAVADFLPITLKQNACLDCHQLEGAKQEGEPTHVPASHFVDLRRAPDQAGDHVAGARWICTACHVARTDAPPAVGSSFRP